MTEGYSQNGAIDAALYSLIAIAEKEGVPDPGDGFRGFYGLGRDLRRVLFLLDEISKRQGALEAPAHGSDRETASGNEPEPALGSDSEAPPGPRTGLEFEQATHLENPTEAKPLTPTETLDEAEPKAEALDPDRDVDADETVADPERSLTTDVLDSAEQKPDAAPGLQPTTVSEIVYNSIEPDPPADNTGARSEAEDTADPQPHEPSNRPFMDKINQTATITKQTGGVPEVSPQGPAHEEVAKMPIETVTKTVYLENARINNQYEGVINVEGLKDLRLHDAGGSKLRLANDQRRLTGTPTTSGDFVILLQGLLHGKRCDVRANLAVIPDPKSLWVSRDTDPNAPFQKPNEAFASVEGDLLCVGASKRGRSHARDGSFRDDDFSLLADGPGGWHIAAVADGAGGAKFSRRGSQVAVETIMADLRPLLEYQVTPALPQFLADRAAGSDRSDGQIRAKLYESLARAAFHASKAIEKEAAANGESASSFSTTLIICAVRKVQDSWFVASFSIGDGGAAIFDIDDGSLKTLSLPDSGEFAGQTRFLQSSEFTKPEEISRRILFDVRTRFTAVALMTDGITDSKFPTDVAFADPKRWVDFWVNDLTRGVDLKRNNENMRQQFLTWLDFWSVGNHDDRTLAVLVP